MSELTERLAARGADMTGAMERFLGDEALFAECYQMFLEDPVFDALDDALEKKDYTAAFNAAHTRKGVSGNLGLTPIYRAACELVESLRRQDTSKLAAQYRAVRDARTAVES